MSDLVGNPEDRFSHDPVHLGFGPSEYTDQPEHRYCLIRFHYPHEDPKLPMKQTVKTDQTAGQMPRLIKVFDGHKAQIVCFVIQQLICPFHYGNPPM